MNMELTFLDNKAGFMYGSVGGRSLGVGPDPAGGNRICALSVLPKSSTNEDATIAFRTAQKQGDASLRQHVLDHHRGAGWICEELVTDMTSSPNFYASEMFQVKLPTIVNGMCHSVYLPISHYPTLPSHRNYDLFANFHVKRLLHSRW